MDPESECQDEEESSVQMGLTENRKICVLLIFHIMLIGQKTGLCILIRKHLKYTCANK
jgi:hypothetical protein